MNNKGEKKTEQVKEQVKEQVDNAAATGLGSHHAQPSVEPPHKPLHPVDSMYAPFDPVQTGGLSPYPGQPGFGPGYQPGYPVHPGCPDCPGNPCIPSYQGMELARAYICIQRWGKVNTPARALETGTLFPDLYRPCS